MKRQLDLHGNVVASLCPTTRDALTVSRRGAHREASCQMDTIGLDLHKRESQLSIKAEDGTLTERRIVTSRERFSPSYWGTGRAPAEDPHRSSVTESGAASPPPTVDRPSGGFQPQPHRDDDWGGADLEHCTGGCARQRAAAQAGIGSAKGLHRERLASRYGRPRRPHRAHRQAVHRTHGGSGRRATPRPVAVAHAAYRIALKLPKV